MAPKDDVLRLLGIRYPIIQAPMAGVSTPALAAAVSNAGGLGSIGIGASTATQAEAMIRETRAMTAHSFNVNVFCNSPALTDPSVVTAWLRHLKPFFEEFGESPPAALREIYRSFVDDRSTLDVLLWERPKVVSFHFGLPRIEWIEEMKAVGIATLACVTTLEEAQEAELAGVDALIVQGVEAGGHRGVFDPARDELLSLSALIPLIVGQTHLPIIAAGGIMDGQGVNAAMRLGAVAAQLGTAFILCPESSADAPYRNALQSERAKHTKVTAAISGRPARGLINRMFTDVGRSDAPTIPDYPIAYDAAKAVQAAATRFGNDDFTVQWAGQGAQFARAFPASELVKLLVREMSDTSI